MGTHAVKVKTPDSKRYEFLTGKGGLTHLRVHAALSTPERCEQFAARIRQDNPGCLVKVVQVLG